MENGKIILLNGTSSSGKTTIAKALQKILTEPYMLIAIDDHFNKLPEWFWTVNKQDEALIRQKTFSAMISGFHKTIPVLAKSGINVIVDHVFEEKEWLS